MELAGLSVAQAVYEVMTERLSQEEREKDGGGSQEKEMKKKKKKKIPSILIVCGPG